MKSAALLLLLAVGAMPKPVFLRIEQVLQECAVAAEMEVLEVVPRNGGAPGSVQMRVTADPALILRGFDLCGQQVQLGLCESGPDTCAQFLTTAIGTEQRLFVVVTGKRTIVAVGPRLPGALRLGWQLRGFCDHAVLFHSKDPALAAEFELQQGNREQVAASARGLHHVLAAERLGLAVTAVQQLLPAARDLGDAAFQQALRELDGSDAAQADAAADVLRRHGAAFVPALAAAAARAHAGLRSKLDGLLRELAPAGSAARWQQAAHRQGDASELALLLTALPGLEGRAAAAAMAHALVLAARLRPPVPMPAEPAARAAALTARLAGLAIVPETLGS